MTDRSWTAKAVELRVLEAAETEAMLPRVGGPRPFGNSMPASRRGWGDTIEPSRFVRRPTPAAIDRMMETVGWIQALPDEMARRFLFAWAQAKVAKGRTLDRFAHEEGKNNRTVRRQITALCQWIANDRNRKGSVRLNDEVDGVSENLAYEAPTKLANDAPAKHPTHWTPEDAKPGAKRFDPADSQVAAVIERAEALKVEHSDLAVPQRRKQGRRAA